MPRPASPTLTDGELRLMNVLWQRGASTVMEIQDGLDAVLSDSTIRTLLGVLEGKGYVVRERSGRAHVYRARVERSDVRTRMVRQVVRRFFRSPADLVLNLLDAGELDAKELARIRQAIEQRERPK